VLKPQDILVALKFLSPAIEARETYAALAESLSLSASEAHAAVRRATRSGLLLPSAARPENLPETRPCTPALAELLCYGIRYFIPAETGRLSLGIPTADSAPPLSTQLAATGAPPYVWPHPRGSVRGVALAPLYSSAPDAALRDPALAEWLALVDALRLATGRIAELARNEVRSRLRDFSYAAAA
jgi:hypothetical protein